MVNDVTSDVSYYFGILLFAFFTNIYLHLKLSYVTIHICNNGVETQTLISQQKLCTLNSPVIYIQISNI